MSEQENPKVKEITTQLIESIENGSAPWQKPWKAGELVFPMNGKTAREYNGINAFNLLNKDYNDPRWYTFNQAKESGLQVKKGQKAKRIRYVNFMKEETVRDADGKVQLDENGQALTKKVLLDKPVTMLYNVFNATQLEGGLAPFQTPEPPQWNSLERAEKLLEQVQKFVAIEHNRRNSAAYNKGTESINLPDKANFGTAEQYYSTVLHEMGHWIAIHNKPQEEVRKYQTAYLTPNGKAKEEIIADITSLLLAQELYLDYFPQDDLNYAAGWAKGLKNKDNCYELYGMVAEAEKRKQQILGLELTHELDKSSEKTMETVEKEKLQKETAQKDVPAQEQQLAGAKTFLAVPFKEKDQAKTLGARWDKDAKLWFAPEGTDLAPLKHWLATPDQNIAVAKSSLSPAEELARVIQDMGGDLQGSLPVLDTKIHRLPRIDAPMLRDTAVSYCAYTDGNPAGWVQNFGTSEKVNWSYSSGHELSAEQKLEFKVQSEQEKLQREQERKALANEKAEWCKGRFLAGTPASKEHPYLQTKGVEPLGIVQNKAGTHIAIPLINAEGAIRSMQYIDGSGQKMFEKDAEKKGNFYLIGATLDDLKKNQPEILVAEGYATGASLHMATGKPVVIAFDSGNLLPVAENIRRVLPEATIVICADNDHRQTVNVGIEKAQEAASKTQGKVIIPVLSVKDKENALTDFNDIHKHKGLDALKKQLEQSLKKAKVQTLEQAPSKGLSR